MRHLMLPRHVGLGALLRSMFSSPGLSSLTLGGLTFVTLLALVALFDRASLTTRWIAVYLTASVMVGGTTMIAYYPARGLWQAEYAADNSYCRATE